MFQRLLYPVFVKHQVCVDGFEAEFVEVSVSFPSVEDVLDTHLRTYPFWSGEGRFSPALASVLQDFSGIAER